MTLKTTPGKASVARFVTGIADAERRRDCRGLLRLLKQITGEPAVMWGTSIVGFGRYRYRYASGREGEWFVTGIAPRKQYLTVYIMPGFENCRELMAKLGRYRSGKSCLYVKRLDDIDQEVLTEIVTRSVVDMARRYPRA